MLRGTGPMISPNVTWRSWSRIEKCGRDRTNFQEMGPQIETTSEAGAGSRLALESALGLGLGCSAGHGTLSPAGGPLTQSSGAVKC